MPAKTLVFTGGGTAGHVMPNLALAPKLREHGWELHYLGSPSGPERALAEGAGIPFHGIATGKLRRYFDWRNFTDPFRVLRGCWDAFSILGKLKPDVVFSKGGFVAVPVSYAAALRSIPLVLHESDLTPGLANRMAFPLARRICASFPETMEALPQGKSVLTGAPVRKELLAGNREAGLAWLGFSPDRPVLLVMGGSLGAKAVNEVVRAAVAQGILGGYQVVHLCGRGWLDPSLEGRADYRQFEFLGAELADVFAAADLAVSRAGAGALFELLALRKPALLVPLPGKASRGDQILNAESFARRGLASVLPQERLTPETLGEALTTLGHEAGAVRERMAASELAHGLDKVLDAVETAARPRSSATEAHPNLLP